MCHCRYLESARLGQDLLNFDAREVLAMADGALVLLLAFEFEDKNLVAATVLSDLAANAGRLSRVAED